jgi:hypothetical protein
MNLCKYKNILGEPGKGVHSVRLFGVAVVDVILTFVLAWVINSFVKTNYFVVLVFCFSLGIILHQIFCVDTTIAKWLKK